VIRGETEPRTETPNEILRRNQHMFRRKGFTLIELLVVMAIIALLLGILLPALNNARARARVMKDGTQIKGIHQAWVTKSVDYINDYPPQTLPTPGLINRVGSIPGRGEEDVTKNDHASLFSASIAQNMFSAPLCVSPSEVSSNVSVCTNYDMTQYDVANDKYWDGDKKGEGVFTDGSPGNFKANLKNSSNVSYGTMPLINPSASNVSVASTRRTKGWKNGGSSSIAILGNRGVQDGIDGSVAGTDVNIFKNSKTLEIHGPKGSWEGNIVFGDNHVDFLNSFYTGTCATLTDLGARVVDKNSNCGATEGLDNMFREDDKKGYSDMWMCVVPYLTSSGAGKVALPTDKTLLYD